MKQISLRISEDVYRQISESAEAEGINASQWIRHAINARLAYQAARAYYDPAVEELRARIARLEAQLEDR